MSTEPSAIAATPGGEHVIEVTWNAGSADASAVAYAFPSKDAADAFVRGAEEALGDRSFAVRDLTRMEPPHALRELVDQLHAFWDRLPEHPQEERAAMCVHFLRALGHADAFDWHSGGGFWHALAGVEVEGRAYVVWTGIDSCGVNPCASLAPSDLVEAFGNPEFGEAYARSAPVEDSPPSATSAPNIG